MNFSSLYDILSLPIILLFACGYTCTIIPILAEFQRISTCIVCFYSQGQCSCVISRAAEHIFFFPFFLLRLKDRQLPQINISYFISKKTLQTTTIYLFIDVYFANNTWPLVSHAFHLILSK